MTDPETEPSMRTEELNYPRVLRLTLADAESMFEEAVASAEAIEAEGEFAAEATRAFQDINDIRQLLTDRRLEVLRSIYDDSPESINALSTRLDRAYAVVHEDIEVLANHGIVLFQEGPRGAKQPYVPYETIRVDIPLVGPSVTASSLQAPSEEEPLQRRADTNQSSSRQEHRGKWIEDAVDPREAGHS